MKFSDWKSKKMAVTWKVTGSNVIGVLRLREPVSTAGISWANPRISLVLNNNTVSVIGHLI